MNPSSDLVNKLWRLCAMLRKDGVTYQQYVTELTYLLFLKMASEQKDESRIPEQYRWGAIKAASETEVLQRYRQALVDLGDPEKVADRSVVAIFQNAATVVREPVNLRRLIDAIDGLHWFTEERDSFGDTYEGLLQKMAEETKRGAGQYFTPRVLIDVMVRLMQPKPGEVIQDPAAGTGGFLIAADRYMRARTDGFFTLGPKQQAFQLQSSLRGMENVQDVYRLLLMNLHLHSIDQPMVPNDTLSPRGAEADFKNADLILTNPPFGPAGGPPTRDDFSITDRVSSYQLPFVEHCIRALKPGGRAAVVVPDNVLVDDGRGKLLRQRLMNWCQLHTILRLPTGIFYAQGVKTNVLFFTRSLDEAPAKDATEEVWIYDLRAGVSAYGKTNPLSPEDLNDFAMVFGDEPNGRAARVDQGETGRFRRFSRADIAARGDSIDFAWLRDESADAEDGLETPEEIAAAIEGHLSATLEEVRTLSEVLRDNLETPTLDRDLVTLPDGWEETTLGEVADFVMGQAPPGDASNFEGVGTPFVKAGEFGPSRPILREWTTKPLKFAKVSDVLICVVGATAGKLNLGADCAIGRSVAAIRPSAATSASFLYPRLRSEVARLRAGSTGTAQGVISTEMLAEIPLALPPIDEQQRIIAKLDTLTARLVRARSELARVATAADASRARALLDRLETAILAKAFRGELVPQDPDDEPASVLLERIRAERAAAPKPKRGRRAQAVGQH